MILKNGEISNYIIEDFIKSTIKELLGQDSIQINNKQYNNNFIKGNKYKLDFSLYNDKSLFKYISKVI